MTIVRTLQVLAKNVWRPANNFDIIGKCSLFADIAVKLEKIQLFKLHNIENDSKTYKTSDLSLNIWSSPWLVDVSLKAFKSKIICPDNCIIVSTPISNFINWDKWYLISSQSLIKSSFSGKFSNCNSMRLILKWRIIVWIGDIRNRKTPCNISFSLLEKVFWSEIICGQ